MAYRKGFRRRSRRSLAAVVSCLVIALLATHPAMAQQPGGDTMPSMSHDGMMNPIMMEMMEGPGMALMQRESLGLTTEQVQRLESLQQRVQATQQESMHQLHAVHAELTAAIDGDLDEARARRAFERMGEIQAELGMSMLHARQETRATLTEQQRNQFAEHLRMHMQEMMRDGMMGGADQRPMDRPDAPGGQQHQH